MLSPCLQVCVWNLAAARDAAREAKTLADEAQEEGLQSITAQAAQSPPERRSV